MSNLHSDTDPANFVTSEHLVAPPIAAVMETGASSAPAIYETEFNQELSESNGLVEHNSSDAMTATNEADAEAAAAAAAIADVFAADTVAQAAEAPEQRWGPSKPTAPTEEEPEEEEGEEPEAPRGGTCYTWGTSASPTSGPARESQPGPVSTSISYATCALPWCTRAGFAHLKGLCPCHYPRKPCGKKWVQVSSGGGARGSQSKDLQPRCAVPNCHRLVSRGTKCRVHHWQSLNRPADDAMMPKLCTAEGCNRLGAPLTEGMCWPHYSAHREHQQQEQQVGYRGSASDAAKPPVEVGGVSHSQEQGTVNSGGCAATAGD